MPRARDRREGQWPLYDSHIEARLSLETVAPPTHEGPVAYPVHELTRSQRAPVVVR